MSESLLNIKNARVREQKEQMEEIAREGICPFCPKYFQKYHAAPIIKEGKFWLVTKNDFPYEGSSQHWLIVYKKHKTKISEIQKEGMKELQTMISWLEKKFSIKGGSFLIRSGDMEYTGATILHIHGHFVVGGKNNGKKESLKVKIGFKK